VKAQLSLKVDIKEKPHFPKKCSFDEKISDFLIFFLNWIVFGEIIDFDFDPNKSKPFGWYLMRLFLMELV